MAHVIPIGRPKCATCGAPAHLEVVNRFNAPVGKFCRRHGAAKRRELEALEQRDATNDGRALPKGNTDGSTG